ncbi:hypothetical protein RRG08_029009 [Elysia crispata]|uniref:Uncharacterized protein n=1 Tax=Elysia crispata TaxID=231223 RepID=A0AAE1B9Z7_9GAST|nr:hypothetical protein RRG08_029009 [Elysia crispata]
MVNLKWERLVGFKWNGMRKKVRKVGVKVISVAKGQGPCRGHGIKFGQVLHPPISPISSSDRDRGEAFSRANPRQLIPQEMEVWRTLTAVRFGAATEDTRIQTSRCNSRQVIACSGKTAMHDIALVRWPLIYTFQLDCGFPGSELGPGSATLQRTVL